MTMRKSELLAVFFAVAVCALAQEPEPDPPSRVARLNYLSGAVSFRPGNADEWSAASLNYPLTIGDHLWTEPGARAEMHVGPSAIRMGSQTAMSFLNLDDRAIQLSVTQGSVQIRVRELAGDESFEVDTPNVAITILRAGRYRVDADGRNNTTTVTAISGDASLTGGGQAFAVHAGQSAFVSGVDEVSYQIAAPPVPDALDDWCDQLDRAEDQVQSSRYVPTDMTGYEDLDRYGSWHQDPGYGWVWMPAGVDAGWAPYRYGRWAWIDPWGWTWVDDAPWGFAPFHYGRWAYLGGGWVWVPGPRTPGIRPVYAPALVVFVGGPRFAGNAVWFPLGPREAYRPQYRFSERYYRGLNGTVNVTVVRYANHGILGGVTAVREADFAGGRHIARVALSVDVGEVARAPVTGFATRIVPRRESFLPGPVREAPRFAERAVVVRARPPAIRARMPLVRVAEPPRSSRPRVAERPAAIRTDDPPRRFGSPQMDRQRPAEAVRRAEPQEAKPPRVEQRRAEPAHAAPMRAEPVRADRPPPSTHREEAPQRRDERHNEHRSERKPEKKQ